MPLEIIAWISGLFATVHGYPIMKLSAMTFLHYSRFSEQGKHPSQNKRSRRMA